MESKELQNSIIAKIDKILENNINENHLHSIAKVILTLFNMLALQG